MQHTKATQLSVYDWLIARGITEQIIKEHLDIVNGDIVIPVYGKHGEFLFNKYRKNPFEKSDRPKYRYDAGASSTLYFVKHTLQSPVIICEGELDALLVESIGLSAVSSTGGAGTFKKEWCEELEKLETFICLDNDEAGLKGAMKIQSMLPKAKMVFLPEGCGKDVTEFVQNYGVAKFLRVLETSESYPIPSEDNEDLDALIKEFANAANEMVVKQRSNFNWQLNVIRKHCLDRMLHYKQQHKRGHHQQKAETIAEIKRIPITNFLKFNSQGFTQCLWHKEIEPSLKYNKPGTPMSNTVHCFGACGKSYDVIDVVMQLDGISFSEAVNKLKS